jgi:hypothetical protein
MSTDVDPSGVSQNGETDDSRTCIKPHVGKSGIRNMGCRSRPPGIGKQAIAQLNRYVPEFYVTV